MTKAPSASSPSHPLTPSSPHPLTWSDRLLRTDVAIGIALALLPFVLFWAETLYQRSFWYHDIQYYFLPYHKLAGDMLRAGQLPLWNPYAFSGIPLLGDGQTAMFYPPNWLFLILPPVWALNLAILLQFAIAGVGMWLFGRSLGLRRGAALLAALAYMFSGFLTTRVVHLSIMSGAALIPLVFWAIERLLQQPTRRHFAVAAVVVAVQAVAGHPQLPVYTTFAVGVYVLVQVIVIAAQSRNLRPSLHVVRLAGVYLAGYALAAIQLVPWFEFAALSPRAAGADYQFVTFHSVGGADWWLWLFPYGFGGVRQSVFWSGGPDIGRAIKVWERSAYIGIPTVVGAVVGVLCLLWLPSSSTSDVPLPRRRGWALIAVLVVGGLIAAGKYTPVGEVVYHIPVLGKLRAYSRAIVLVSFAGCGLAGWGAQCLATARTWRVLRWYLAVAIGIVGLPVVVALMIANDARLRLSSGYTSELWQNLRLAEPRAWLPLVLVIATALLLPWLRRRAGLAALTTLLLIDMGLYAASFNPTTDPEALQGTPTSVQFLQSDPEPYRTASFITNDTLAPPVAQAQLALSWSMFYDISNINGFNSLQPRRYTDVLFGPTVGDVSYGFLGDPGLLQPTHNLLSMLNAKYALLQAGSQITPGSTWDRVFGDEHVTIYRDRRALPRAWFVPEVRAVTAPEALAAVRNGARDIRGTAFVEDIDPLTPRQLSPIVRQNTVKVTQGSPNDLAITTMNPQQQFLVISEPWFAGWEAQIDNQPTPIYRTDYLLRGVIVPAGTHTIMMRYRPRSAFIGAGVSAAMVVVLGGLGLWRRKRSLSASHVTDATSVAA